MPGSIFFHRQRFSAYLFWVCCTFLVILTTGCGDESANPATADNVTADSSDTGSASFSIRWHTASDNPNSVSSLVRSAIGDCSTAGVETVTCKVYDPSNTLIASDGPWACEDHGASMERIPAGQNRIFAVLGWDSTGERIVYQGQTSSGIDINPGEIADAGTIDAHPFVPTGLEAATISDSRIDLAWDDLDVSGYHVYRDGVMIATTVSPAYSDTNLSADTQYCYTVSSLDAFDNESAQSDEACATTEPSDDDVDNDGDGYSEIQGDCNDADANVNPGATEICGDGIDQDCNGADLSCDDVDNDGDGYSEIQGDCNDANANVNPEATEVCNGVDDNCAGGIDEGLSTDADGDRHYTPDSCFTPNDDCDDTNDSVYAGATEICGDGIDQDCSGADLSCDDVDNDGDGYSENQGDCNDANANVNPGATEVCNGVDDNCAGGIDEGLSTDADGDRHYTPDSCFTPNDDCDDTRNSVYPGATEICGDGIDQDCNGADLSCDDVDNDGDGYSENQGDCNDANANVNPGAAEVCNGVDDNCAGGIDEGLSTDADGDRHYTPDSCFTPADDCDDSNPNVNPDATEVCNGVDDNCAGGIDEGLSTDADGDGHYTPGSCFTPADDCDDSDSARFPGNAEVCDNNDNNCNDVVDEGLSRSTTCGVGACAGNTGTETCTAGQWGNDTCDPDAGAEPEECDNVDNDCDGSVDENLSRTTTCGVGACAGNTGTETCTAGQWGNDTCDPDAGATSEVCDNVDNDCDGSTDEDYPDLGTTCTSGTGVCEESGVMVCAYDQQGTICNAVPGTPSDEICNGLDDDCDGYVDEEGVCTACYPDLSDPNLAYTGSEVLGDGYTRYYLEVTNRNIYPDELFTPAPHLPPCGSNTNSSRTWVEIYDDAGPFLNRFCALSSSANLESIWFAIPSDENPPEYVLVDIIDRDCDISYLSNSVAIDDGPLVPFDFDSSNEGWRMAGLYDDGGLTPISGYFSNDSAPHTMIDGSPSAGSIALGSGGFTFPSSPTGDTYIHWDLNSPDLSNNTQWQGISSFSYRITGQHIWTSRAIYVQAVLHVRRPDYETYYTDDNFHLIPTESSGYWQTHNVDVSSFGMPAGTIILNINLRIFFEANSGHDGYVLVDHVAQTR